MTDFKIESCNKANIKTIVDGINNYNLEKVPAVSEIWTRLEFIMTDDNEIEMKVAQMKIADMKVELDSATYLPPI